VEYKVSQRPKVIDKREVLFGNIVVPYTLKRSSKAKLLWLTMSKENGLVVTVPRYYDIDLLDSYLYTKSKWILRTQKKVDIQEPRNTTNQFIDTLMYFGKRLTITKNTNQSEIMEVKLEDDQVIVNLDPGLKIKYSDTIEMWMKDQAIAAINTKAGFFSSKLGLTYSKISIRNQRSRWGSCSRKRNLSFNWRLIMAPEAILDYVIIHELCHLREMSHSKSFWELIGLYCPNWKENRKWLNKHGRELYIAINIEE
jgi:predicted metal-dependent hydrolase